MKITGIIILIAISAVTGNYFAVKLGRRLELLGRLEYMLEKTGILIRCRAATVYELMEELSRDKRLEGLDFLKSAAHCGKDIPFHELWEMCVREYHSPYLKGEDIDFILSVGAELGTSDTEGQLKALEMSRAALSLTIKKARDEYGKKASLYRSMGVLAGAFAAVLLI